MNFMSQPQEKKSYRMQTQCSSILCGWQCTQPIWCCPLQPFQIVLMYCTVVHKQYFSMKYVVPEYIFVSPIYFIFGAPSILIWGIINYNQVHFQGLKKQLIKNTSSSQESPKQIEKLMCVVGFGNFTSRPNRRNFQREIS